MKTKTTDADIERVSDLWWRAPKKDEKDPDGKKLAQALNRSATRREIANIPQRWRNYVYYREMTGRPTLMQFAYGMAKRPQAFVGYYSRFAFGGVKSRFAGTMCDVYVNRMLSHQTFMSFVPTKGRAEERQSAEDMEIALEAEWNQLDYWKKRNSSGLECFWYGTGVVGWDDETGKIANVNPDELLYSNPDDDDPYDVIHRIWGKKSELLEQHKDDPRAVRAIMEAETANPAFYFGRPELDCTDVIPLLKGWTKPMRVPSRNGQSRLIPGRYVKVIGSYTLDDEPWEWPHPFERFCFNELPGSLFGQGIGELLLQISMWIDSLLTTWQECQVRAGRPKWLVEENSNVNPDVLGDAIAAIATYLGVKPELVTPEAVGKYMEECLAFLMNLGRSIVHVSEAAVKGEMPAGITAAVAMEKYSQIDDQNFLEKIGRAEDWDKRNAFQTAMMFKRRRHKTPVGDGRVIEWEKVKFNDSFRMDNVTAFNVGRLSQTVAGRVQVLEQMYANKVIPKRLYVKYSPMPDIPGLYSELNAETDAIDKQLDNLVKSAEYIPPTPFMDLAYAKMAVENRMAREETKDADQATQDRLSMWRATVMSFIEQNTTPPAEFGIPLPPDAAAAGGDPGLPPPGVAPPPQLPLLQTAAAPGGM